MRATDQIEELKILTQKAAAWMCGVTPRALRNWDPPQNRDGTYNAGDLLAWMVQRESPMLEDDDDDLRSKKMRVEIEKLSEQIELLQRQRKQVDRETVPVGEVQTIFDTIQRTSQQTCRQLERKCGPEARELFASFWENCLGMLDQLQEDAA